jgi:subtilisin family serine protease
MYLSHNTVLMAFAVGTTVQQANALLMPLGGQLVGGIKGVSGTVPSILMVKLATTSHVELEAALTTLRASPAVLHVVQDILLSEDALPESTGWVPDLWQWEWVQPAGGNWGLELIRVPQMWNLNRAVEKMGSATWIGVLDGGFSLDNMDLESIPTVNLNPGRVREHGTHVAGIIAADFWNKAGIEGVNPFSGLVLDPVRYTGFASVFPDMRSWGEVAISAFILLADAFPEVAVINMSQGYNWHLEGVDTNTLVGAQDLANEQGALLKLELDALATRRPLPIFITSAGNSSDSGFGPQAAKYNNPMCNAALEQGAANILVVENVEYDAASPGEAIRSASSNVGGHLSAPGTDILSTLPNGLFGPKTGTSMAAPHVAGLVGYMLAVDPTLTIQQIRTALFNTSIPVGGLASNRIDAWAAVMEIDQVQGDDKVLRRMVDIDDGTLDGNQRVRTDMVGFPDYDEEDADGDGGLGDGRVDMSDFRVWRDWYLKIWEPGTAEFDGREDHPKMDVNDDGKTEDDVGESHYPRGDFNGDGILTLEDSVWVLGAVQDSLSDLDVLKVVFDDPDIEKESLDTLVYSSDVTVDASIAFDVYTSSPIHAEMWQKGLKTLAQKFTLTADEPRKTFTVRSLPAGYIFEVRIGSESRFVNSYRVLATRPGTDAVVWPIKPLPVNVKSTFLNSCDDAGATTAQGISLQSLRVEPGDFLYLNAAWDSPHVSELVAVFSASNQLQIQTEQVPGDPPKILTRRTVTDAITIGNDLLSGSTYPSPPTRECGGVATNIPQDFTTSPGSFVKIPDGATHLFFGMGSDYYDDNGGGNIRIRISKWYVPEWHDMHQPVAPLRKER